MSKKVEKVLRKVIAEEVAKQVSTLIKEQGEEEEQGSQSLSDVLKQILTDAELTKLRPFVQGKSAQEVANFLATLIDHVLKDIKIPDSTLKQAMRALNMLVQKQGSEEGK